MTPEERVQAKEWVDNWKTTGPILEELRDAEIRKSETSAMIMSGNLLFRDAVKNFPPQPESGLVEQQRWFMKLHSR